MNHFLSSLNDEKVGKSQINYFVKNYTVANLKTKEDTKKSTMDSQKTKAGRHLKTGLR